MIEVGLVVFLCACFMALGACVNELWHLFQEDKSWAHLKETWRIHDEIVANYKEIADKAADMAFTAMEQVEFLKKKVGLNKVKK